MEIGCVLCCAAGLERSINARCRLSDNRCRCRAHTCLPFVVICSNNKFLMKVKIANSPFRKIFDRKVHGVNESGLEKCSRNEDAKASGKSPLMQLGSCCFKRAHQAAPG